MSIKGMVNRSTRHPVEQTGARRGLLNRSWPGRDFFMGLSLATNASKLTVGYFFAYCTGKRRKGVIGYIEPALSTLSRNFSYRLSLPSYPGRYEPESIWVCLGHCPGGFGVSFFLPACGCSSLFYCCICVWGTAGYRSKPRRLSLGFFHCTASNVQAAFWIAVYEPWAGGYNSTPCRLASYKLHPQAARANEAKTIIQWLSHVLMEY